VRLDVGLVLAGSPERMLEDPVRGGEGRRPLGVGPDDDDDLPLHVGMGNRWPGSPQVRVVVGVGVQHDGAICQRVLGGKDRR
jgi:hypothetical protein